MKKNLLTLVLSGTIAFTWSPYVLAKNVATIQSNTDYSQLVTKRQVVDHLLDEAVKAFKSPARISHAGFTAKMPSNMEVVTNRLLEAYKLEPYRTDLLISAANAQIYNKNVDKAIELFAQCEGRPTSAGTVDSKIWSDSSILWSLILFGSLSL